MNKLPRWRIAAGCLVLAILLFLATLFTPVYIHNFLLQNYVDELTHRTGSDRESDPALVALVLEKAHSLALPVAAENVHIIRSSDELRIDVSYLVTVRAPLYEVNLHFYPGAGSR